MSKCSLKRGFTLAEALITLAIIGVVAALTIPAVIVDTQQQEFKTGLAKAVNSIDNAIKAGRAKDGETPYTTELSLFNFLQRHMNVVKTVKEKDVVNGNYAFYTADGMRYDFTTVWKYKWFHLYDSKIPCEGNDPFPYLCAGAYEDTALNNWLSPNHSNHCGSQGLVEGDMKAKAAPCIITVDVNGDKKPSKYGDSSYKSSKPNSLTDVFLIMVTDQGAMPYGVAAQKAMYDLQY